MIINKLDLVRSKEIVLDSDDEVTLDDISLITGIISLNSMHVHLKARYIEGMDLAIVDLKIKGNLKIKSTRTLKPLDIDCENEDSITYTFTYDKDLDDEDIIYCDKNEIDLHDEIVSLIVTSLPIKIVGEDEPESFQKDNWEVISEEEYNKRKKNNNTAFDCLKDLDLDD